MTTKLAQLAPAAIRRFAGEKGGPRFGWTTEARRAMFVDVAESELITAVDLLAAGDWQAAHEIVQKHDSTLGAWLHGIVHTLEGDDDNARYWYRQAGRTFRGRTAVEEEIAAARQAASAD